MDRRWQVAGVVALALLILACGSTAGTGGGATTGTATTAPAAPTTAAAATDAPAPTPAPTGPAKVGERVEQNGTALTVVSVEKKAELSQFQKAKDGNIFIVAEVLIENAGSDKIPYNPLYFKVKDADGFEYSATIYTGDNGLKSGDLAAGDKARGVIAVEVKEGAKGLILSYQPITFGAEDPIRVALE